MYQFRKWNKLCESPIHVRMYACECMHVYMCVCKNDVDDEFSVQIQVHWL